MTSESPSQLPSPQRTTRTPSARGQKAPRSQASAIEFFESQQNDKVTECSFIGQFDDGYVYELWYLRKEWFVAFVVMRANGRGELIDGTSELLNMINQNHQLQAETLSLARDRRIRLWVGSAAFLAALGTVLYLAVKDPTNAVLAVGAVVSVVASGCVAILGVWAPTSGLLGKPARAAQEAVPKVRASGASRSETGA